MNVFDLFATLSLNTNAYEKALDDAELKGEQTSENIARSGSSGASKFASALSTVGKVTVAGFVAAGTGIAALTKQSVDAYGQYQQLVGGAELMFGESSTKVLNNAANAFSTMQLSQNEYLQQANMFAVGLTNALEGDANAAADLVNKIMQTEADIVAATGQDMQLVQNAFNGIMRNNYMMLDNLGLGIKPTKEGMQEVIDKVNEYNEAQGNATNYTIENLADQEAALIQYVEMQGLAGWASMEAGSTITGSIGQVGAAWKNLIIGMADPKADLGLLISNVVETAKGALNNLMPIITQALTGVGSLVAQAVPVIADELPVLIESTLPNLLDAASNLIIGVVKALPSLLGVLTTALPNLLRQALPALLKVLPDVVRSAVAIVAALAEGIGESLPVLIPAITECIMSIIEVLTEPENVQLLTNATFVLIGGIIAGIGLSLPDILSGLWGLVKNIAANIVNFFPTLWEATSSLLALWINAIWEKVKGDLGLTNDMVSQGMSNILNTISGWLESIKDFFGQVWDNIVTTVSAIWEYWIPESFKTGLASAYDVVESGLTKVSDFFGSIWDKIKEGVSKGIDAVKDLFSHLFDFLKDLPMPHISVSGGTAPYGIGGQGSLPSFDVQWYKKAYDDAYILNSPTIFGLAGGRLMGGGEGQGGEAIVGTDLLVDMMRQAVAEGGAPQIDVHVYIGGEEVDGFVVQSNQRNALISGGKV